MSQTNKRESIERVRQLMRDLEVTTSDLLMAEAEEVVPADSQVDLSMPDISDFEVEE